MSTPGLPPPRSKLRSDRVLVEADMGQLRAGGDTVLPGRQEE
jgi:hypothetical protein